MKSQRKHLGWVSRSLALSAFLALCPGGASRAQSAPPGSASMPASAAIRFPIKIEQVMAAIDASTLTLRGGKITLLANVTATSHEPALEVGTVESWGSRRAGVLIRCRQRAACMPFYVTADWPTSEAATLSLHPRSIGAALPSGGSPTGIHKQPDASGKTPLLDAQSRSTEPETKPVPGFIGKEDSRETWSQAAAIESPVSLPLVHTGTHATLLIDGDRLHIQVPVICLETGSAGRTIRVTAADHRQTYLAEVVNGSLLKGTF